MSKKTILKLVAVLVVVGVAGFFGYSYYSDIQRDNEIKSTVLVEAEAKDLVETVSATGTIRPLDSVEVSPKVTGRLKEVLVKENDVVKAGQLVAVQDTEEYDTTRNQAAYKLEKDALEYERITRLYEIGAKSKQELDTATYNYLDAQAALKNTETKISDMEIVAPMDGVVVGEPKTVGTMAVQGSNVPTVIMVIADLSKKQILAKVDETDIGKVKVGQRATFTVDTYNDKVFTATVSKISQTDVSNSWNVNSSSSSSSSSTSASVIYYYVVLDIDDPENLLLPAMTARVDIITSEKNGATAVPLSALRTDADGSYVQLALPEGKSEKRPVTVGIYSNEYAEIIEGLSPGDKLIVDYKAEDTSKKQQKQGGGPPPQ